MGTLVVYVHGLWFGGGESLLLRRRLARALDAECRVFSYPSMSGTLAEVALALTAYLRQIEADTLHLIGHSMGGLLILRTFDPPPAVGLSGAGAGAGAAGIAGLPPGRIVLTGAPVRGSLSARRFESLPLGGALLGRMGREALLAPGEPRWQGARDLGVIAGDLGVGLGRLVGRMHAPNDGTVLVSETDLPGARDRIRLPVSHTGLVFSRAVARQAAVFLRDGRFEC